MRTWNTIKEYKEILFDEYNGIARITINRPRYRNAFTPRGARHLCCGTNGCWRQSLLFWRRYARKRSWRICRRRWRASSQCTRRSKANSLFAQACHCYG